MPTWPNTLPATPQADSFRETVPTTLVRTEMEQGPAKVRRRSTAGVRKLSMSFVMSKAQIATLETFITTALSGGALAFDYTHPRSGASLSCRFRQMPEYASLNGVFFKVAIELEVLP